MISMTLLGSCSSLRTGVLVLARRNKHVDLFGVPLAPGWASVNNANELTFAPLGGQLETEYWDGYAHPALKTIGAGLEAFAADIEGGSSFPVSPNQILHGVAVLDAIFRSINSGKVEVP